MLEVVTTGSFQTNSYILSNEKKECIIIDPGLDYKKVAEYIKEKYIPKAILLTHGHLDHIDGILYFMDLPIYVSEDDEESLYDTDKALYTFLGRISPFNKGDLNIHILKDKDKFNLIGFDIEAYLTPGHTEGSMIFYIDSLLFSGDTLFYLSCGRTDFPSGDSKKMKESLNFIVNHFPLDTKVYPGHGECTTIKNEKDCNPYIGNNYYNRDFI